MVRRTQGIPSIDADLSRHRREIAKKGHLWMETNEVNGRENKYLDEG